MKRLIVSVLLAVSLALPVVAQDTPTPDFATPVETVAPSPEPTLDVTSTSTPVPPVDLPDNAVVTNGLQLILLLVLAALGGGGAVAIVTAFLQSAEARAAGKRLYEAMPPEQQEWLKQRIIELEKTNHELIDYLKDVTKTSDPVDTQAVNTRLNKVEADVRAISSGGIPPQG